MIRPPLSPSLLLRLTVSCCAVAALLSTAGTAAVPPNPGGKLWYECRPGSGPCDPKPKWPVTYMMNESVQLMAFSNPTYRVGPVPAAYPANRWAIFDVDWNSNKPTWGAAQPQNCSEMMAQQIADMAASVSPQPSVPKRYMTYRNFVKALPLLTPVREIMNDRSYDVWFVNFSAAVQADHAKSHVPLCDVNMTLCGRGDQYRYSAGAVLQPPKCSHL